MNQTLQPAQHPDADQLAAFTEGALPLHERESTLAHLALCGECRELVSLSLPPLEDLQSVNVLPARRRVKGWRLLWAGGAMCAGLALGSALWVGHQASPAPAEIAVARVEAPAAPAAPPQAPARAAAAAPPAKTSPPPAPALSKPANVLGAPSVADAAPVAQAPDPVAGAVISAQELQDLPLNGRSLTLREQSPSSPQSQVHSAQDSVGGSLAALKATPAPAPKAAPQALALQQQAAASTVEVNADNAVAVNAPLSQLLPELPSHLQTVSSYAQGKRMVAADSAGTVFFSKDTGRHWTAVKSPWGGHVLRVGAPGQVTVTTPSLPAQEDAGAGNATLQGVVRDATGAMVPGTQVSVLGADVTLRTRADRAGHYAVRGCIPTALCHGFS